jgi:F-type H+-transporting ATPase subunit b
MNINLTLFAQMIAFAVFVGFCMKYVWPPIVTALAERKAKIAEGPGRSRARSPGEGAW